MTDETQSDFPSAWRPDQSDEKTVNGRVVGVSMSPDFGFGPYPIVTIKNTAGEEIAIHAMHQILRTELAKRKPGPGDDLEVTYLGKRAPKSGSGNPFHVYRVAGGKEPQFNWDNQLPEEERVAFQTTPPPQSSPAEPDVPIDDSDLPF